MSENHADTSGINGTFYNKRHTEETKNKMALAKGGKTFQVFKDNKFVKGKYMVGAGRNG